ncbi:diguanylate cyclase [Actinoplanes sp. KI2]|uniref:GGDEF domain-containing protein n=1 Tax=Actinoplanes sp. KI2 TaxID=2983315 RepID=UPI0021D5A828|nr:diguanylate cyclase [Actinoplanes sp. KI2]MCU7726797.1 diguanylate cyclase [Actinoplanes sp. KI2]
MTLRGRLTAAFLVVVLGPVLLGSIFVALTVATVSRNRAADRLDHAASTVRTGISAICRQLQGAADAVAVVPAGERSAVAGQLVARGLATDIRIVPATPIGAGSRSKPAGAGDNWQDCAAPTDGPAGAIAASTVVDTYAITATQTVDAAFLERLGAVSGAHVTLGGQAGPNGRELSAGPGEPLRLTVTVPHPKPHFLYAVLVTVVLAAGTAAILVARWLAHSTTRPLGDLAWAADQVAGGDLDTRVPIVRPDELGRLAATFNRMTRELKAYVRALTASRDQLRGHLAILGETLSSTHDVDRILQVILRTALAATGARAGLVLLLDPVGGHLVAHTAIGLTGAWDVPEAELGALRLPVGSGVLGEVAAGGEPRRGHGTIAEAEPPCRTYLAVPIQAPRGHGFSAPSVGLDADDPLRPGEGGPATLGVLALYDRVGGEDFDDADLHTLRTFAGQAGVAVHNVRMHEEAQRLSLTDPLTGLWNYRCLRESVRREVERASRFGRMLAVLVLDLDHFKEVNDTYGHAAGDAVLGEFARRIRIGLREVDVAFRQGGEEFVVLLPETDAYGGVIVAERLGAAVRDRPVSIDVGGVIPVTVSIGVAVFPEHGKTAQEVLQAADDALYAAKSAGRDTYRLADTADRVRKANFDSGTGSGGGPQPPRQARGR